jgi:hypothetical protein
MTLTVPGSTPRVFSAFRVMAVLVAVAGTTGVSPTVAHGAAITVGGLITVTADDGASFKAGDTFAYSFSFDDQAVDTAGETFNARFNAAVSAFSLTPGSGNVGTWNPSVGTFTVAPVNNFALNSNSDQITLQVAGSGIPAINGNPFLDVGITFGFGGVQDFVDTGSGQSFEQVVGVSPLDFSTAAWAFAEFRNNQFQSPSLTTTVNPVPEPAGLTLAAGAVVGLACGSSVVFRRRPRPSPALAASSWLR